MEGHDEPVLVHNKCFRAGTKVIDGDGNLKLIEDVEVDEELFVDFIGKFENLNKDFEVLCDKLNLDYKLLKLRGYTGLPTVRFGGSHGNYKTYYDDETIELVSNVYRRDLELFDYEY